MIIIIIISVNKMKLPKVNSLLTIDNLFIVSGFQKLVSSKNLSDLEQANCSEACSGFFYMGR